MFGTTVVVEYCVAMEPHVNRRRHRRDTDNSRPRWWKAARYLALQPMREQSTYVQLQKGVLVNSYHADDLKPD